MNYEEVIKENKILKNKIMELQMNIKFLTEQNIILSKHDKLATGIRGETLIASVLGGNQTGSTESYDVELQGRKITIEVKTAKLNYVSVGKSKTKRWNWARPFGELGGKVFDHLILLGDSDPDYQHMYLDPSSPFICFDIPFSEIMPLTIKSNSYRSIQLTTNPKTARSAASYLFTKYQVTFEDLRNRYNL